MIVLPLQKKLIVGFIFIFVCCGVWTQAHISTQAHQAEITALAFSKDGSFFSAAKDGFLIRWTDDGLGEHYQITELTIPLIAIHPNGSVIAVYETDGFSVHRVSIWNWATLKRKFVKTFSNNVTSLDFTGQGSLLAVGTATVNGMVFLNPSNGRTVSKIKEPTGIVTMFFSSSSEKSAVLYSPTGTLSYYNMTNGTRKQRFHTEPQLEQVTLFNNNMFIAGVKNNQIYIIDALTGKTSARISARTPILVSDENSSIIYYVETDGRNFSLKALETGLTNEGTSISNPIAIKNLTGVNAANTITTGLFSEKQILLGSNSGNIFAMAFNKSIPAIEVSQNSESIPPKENHNSQEDATIPPPKREVGDLVVITENMYDKIYDIVSIGDDFYFLTKDSIFKSTYDTGKIDSKGQHSGYTNILAYKDDVILWSRGTKKTVSLMNLETNEITPLFTPKVYVENLRLFEDKIVYIEGSTTVKLYDIFTDSNLELYTGTGIQDAVLYKGTDLYVAKSASSNPRSPLISVNTETQETVMMPVDGSVAFSLTLGQTENSNLIYGIHATAKGTNSQTTIFSFTPERKRTSAIMKVAGEDVSAFLTMYDDTIYTNIGKNNIRAYNTKTRREIPMARSASLPLKLDRSGNRIAVLNRDGSISWYSSENGQVIADWYMTTEKQWYEF